MYLLNCWVSLVGYDLLLQKLFEIFVYIILIKLKSLILMNTIIVTGILVEIVVVIGGIYIMKQLQKKQTRLPALSKKIIRNLKF